MANGDAIAKLQAQGLTDQQIRSLAEQGLVPSYLRSMDVSQNLQSAVDTGAAATQSAIEQGQAAQELEQMRGAQSEYEAAQKNAAAVGIPQDFGRGEPPSPEVPPIVAPAVDPKDLVTRPPVQPAPALDTGAADKELALQYLASQGGFNKAVEAIKNQASFATSLGEAQAKLQQSYNEETQRIREKQQELAAQRAADSQRLLSEIDTDVKNLADTKIDPGAFWAKKSTGDKILAGLSIALSGFAEGYAGRSGNPALTMINKAIQDDILAQRENHMSQRAGIAEKRSAYNNLMNKYQNEEAALAGAKAAALERMQGQVAEMAARKSGTEAAINAEKMIAQLQMEKEAANQKVALELMKQNRKQSTDMRPLKIEGVGYAYNAKDAEEIRKMQGNVAFSDQKIDEMLAKIDQYGVSDAISPSQLDSDLKTIAEFLRASSRPLLLGPGTVQEQEYLRLVDLIPSGRSVNPVARATAKNTLRALKRMNRGLLDMQMQSRIEGYQGRIKSELGAGAKRVE